MFFEEFTDPIMPERREPEEEKIGYSDPELARTLDRVATRYPYYKKGAEGFMKYAQRAIKHSEETDSEHTATLSNIAAEIEELKLVIAKLQQQQ